MSTDEQRRALSRLVFQWRTAHPDGPDDPGDDPEFLRQARILQGLDPETGARLTP
ncbi:hypothetical protein [Planomonospora sp. ID82291]|uniref:hypothetical protein n=1 Tax=Planomonospora sp. ID82291 TaxID=2738136 RepID=UPI0018C433B2|nr:hypothetical protein [Planomonospora sp. ID82291]MBG0818768.1 hypothetical protein [Planomonospora sp. ID82291]